jgi:hypothetical protein
MLLRKARFFAALSEGSRSAAITATIAMTTMSSMSVKAMSRKLLVRLEVLMLYPVA